MKSQTSIFVVIMMLCVAKSTITEDTQINLEELNNFDYKQHGDDWKGQCNSNFTKQSPIILTDKQPTLGDSYIIAEYRPSKTVISFLNTTLYIRAASLQTGYGELYTYTVDNNAIAFRATQIRFRSHSEHRINTMDGYYDLELQIFHNEVYQSHNNYKIGVGIFFEAGQQANPFLDQVIEAYTQNATSITADLSQFLGKYNEMGYWYYLGSGTIPPCNDGKLYWIILKQVFTMSPQQRDFFYEMFNNDNMEGNWRNIQDSSKNQVKFYSGYQQQL